MTSQATRDALAAMDGWKHVLRHTHASGLGQMWWKRDNGDESFDHPHPPTLDGADAAMPEGWWWSRYETGAEGVKWCAGPRNGFASVYVYDTGNKTADLYRLAVLCWLAEREASK